MSKVPELIDALVEALRAEPAFADVVITDGPEINGEDAPDWVFVGFDGDPNGDFSAAVVEEDWLSLGADRGEQIALPLALVSRTGDTEVKPARDRVYALLAVVRAVFRADPTLGIPQTQAGVASTTLFQDQTDAGMQARLLLSVGCRTLG